MQDLIMLCRRGVNNPLLQTNIKAPEGAFFIKKTQVEQFICKFNVN